VAVTLGLVMMVPHSISETKKLVMFVLILIQETGTYVQIDIHVAFSDLFRNEPYTDCKNEVRFEVFMMVTMKNGVF
jgi:hypothetical protein